MAEDDAFSCEAVEVAEWENQKSQRRDEIKALEEQEADNE